MGDPNVNPLDEVRSIEAEIDLTNDVAALKPLYSRLNEIARSNIEDFDVELAVNEARQHVMARATALKQRGAASHLPPAHVQPPPSEADRAGTEERPTQEPAPEPAMPEVESPQEAFAFNDTAAQAPPEPPPVAGAEPARPNSGLAWWPVPPLAGLSWNRLLMLVPIAGMILAIVLIVFTVQLTRKRSEAIAAKTRAVQVDVATVPPGASVRLIRSLAVAGAPRETACKSNCRVALAPGDYQVTASLPGFEPAAGSVHVAAGKPAVMSLPLRPQAQSVRLLTDLEQGKVFLDNRPPANLQEGQLVFDKVPPGAHTLTVAGRNGDASFPFDIADARLPVVSGPVVTHNLIAVLVSSFGKAARVVTSAGPLKLTVNGRPQADAGPAGTDVADFQPGVNEIVVGEGHDQHNVSEIFGDAPMLTAFLKSDVNAGTLIVSTGLDDVRVYLNDREYRRRTQRGQLRIQTLGKVTVRVAKSGFLDDPPQTAEVKKGEEVRLEFALKPQPQFGSLEILDGTPGAEVLLDQKNIGAVGADGVFRLNTIQPGERAIELRHAQYKPKDFRRTFQAGQTVVLAGADSVLVSADGTIHLSSEPAGARFAYRRTDETEPHEIKGNQIELPAGSYVVTASAPGFTEGTSRVQLAGGENQGLEFRLVRERPVAPPPAPVHGMADFEDPQSWKKEGDAWVHKGGGFIPYKLADQGVFTFTVQLLKSGSLIPFRAGKIRWCVEYTDPKNYLLYEMDRKVFWAGVILKGERFERVKTPHNLDNPRSFTIRIEVTPDQLVQKVLVGNEWKVLDTFSEPGRDFTKGKFGFLVQGNDEIAISDFKFVGK